MLRFLCPQAAAPLHIPRSGSPQSCELVRIFPHPYPSLEEPRFMKSSHLISLAVSCAALGLVAPAAFADEPATAITIYSSAQPGAISPEFYRPIPGQGVPNAMSVPGYALVRDEREMSIKQGRSQVSFTDVAALIDPPRSPSLRCRIRRRESSNRISSSTWSAPRSCCSSSSTARSPSTRTPVIR